MPLFLEGGNGLSIGRSAVTGLGWLARGACHCGTSKQMLSEFEARSAPAA